MKGVLQQKISPPVVRNSLDFNDMKSSSKTSPVQGSGSKSTIDFKNVLINSNRDEANRRKAMEAGDLSGAKSYEDFLEQLNRQTKKQRVPKNSLDKDDFLKLFVTQLQHQDPLNPKDGAEMASQLAQFNGLEQMMNVNTTLGKLEKAQKVGHSIDYVNYIGKEVAVDGGKVRLGDKGIGDVTFNVGQDLSSATLEVRDVSGAVVAIKDLNMIPRGDHQLKWDGQGKDGQKIPKGVYSVSIVGKSIKGEEIPVNITSRVLITGIDMNSDKSEFYTSIGKMGFGDISAVGQKGFNKNATIQPETKPIENSNIGKNLPLNNVKPVPKEIQQAATVPQNLKTPQPMQQPKVNPLDKPNVDGKLPVQPFSPQIPGAFEGLKASEPLPPSSEKVSSTSTSKKPSSVPTTPKQS